MTRSTRIFTITLCTLLFVAAGCKKDELTVVSTDVSHACGMKTITLNVDSLIQEHGTWWNAIPDQHFTYCACDTVDLVAGNTPSPWYFARWYFGDMPMETNHWDAVLDTITVATYVTLDLHSDASPPDPDHLHIRVHLHTQDCK